MTRAIRGSTPSNLVCAVFVVLAAASGVPAVAVGAEIVSWEDEAVSESRFVDPANAPDSAYPEPPGVPERPNGLRANVYLPNGYDPQADNRYPVLYLLHGLGDAYDTWANPRKGALLETAPDFPGFIVMPEGADGHYVNWWNGGALGDPAWERYHLDQVISAVEERLPIKRGRRWHSIAGLSMGGKGAMFYASQRPDYFGSAASFSGPLSIQAHGYRLRPQILGDPVAQEFYWRGHNPTALTPNLEHTRLYVANGDGTTSNPAELVDIFGADAERFFLKHALDFTAAAESVGAPITTNIRKGIHEWAYWRSDLRDAIAWGLFERPPETRNHWRYSTVARSGRMWGFRFRFFEQPSELITFEREAASLRGTGSGRLRIRTRSGCARVIELPEKVRLPLGC